MNIVYSKISNIFLDIFFPKRCVGCGAYGTFVCNECALKIEPLLTSTCPICGKITEAGKYCNLCRKKLKPVLSGLMVSALYDSGPLKEMIHHLKYSGFTELVPILSELLYQRINREKLFLTEKIIVVPVPLHFKREAKRGFNQAELISLDFSKKLKLHGGCALKRIRNTETQVSLNKVERHKNLSGAFVCIDQELIRKKTVLLVDDVTTSGATLSECARVLKEAGAKKVFGAVVAKRL